MKTYICTVSNRFPENYHIGLQAHRWGVEERYRKRIDKVQPGDQLAFLVGGIFLTLHKIEGSMFKEDNLLWSKKDGSIFPYRIKISNPIAESNKSAKELASQISMEQMTILMHFLSQSSISN